MRIPTACRHYRLPPKPTIYHTYHAMVITYHYYTTYLLPSAYHTSLLLPPACLFPALHRAGATYLTLCLPSSCTHSAWDDLSGCISSYHLSHTYHQALPLVRALPCTHTTCVAPRCPQLPTPCRRTTPHHRLISCHCRAPTTAYPASVGSMPSQLPYNTYSPTHRCFIPVHYSLAAPPCFAAHA